LSGVVSDASQIDISPFNRKKVNSGKSVLFEAAIIVIVAAALALVYQLRGGGDVRLDDGGVYIPIEQISEFPNAMWMDARTLEEFEKMHVAGAVLLNEENWEELLVPFLDKWDPDRTILVYCSRSACLRSLHVAKRLRSELGVENVFAIEGGWVDVVKSGVPLR